MACETWLPGRTVQVWDISVTAGSAGAERRLTCLTDSQSRVCPLDLETDSNCGRPIPGSIPEKSQVSIGGWDSQKLHTSNGTSLWVLVAMKWNYSNIGCIAFRSFVLTNMVPHSSFRTSEVIAICNECNFLGLRYTKSVTHTFPPSLPINNTCTMSLVLLCNKV